MRVCKSGIPAYSTRYTQSDTIETVPQTPNLGYELAGIGPRDTTDNNLRIGDAVNLKNYGRFRATTGKIVKVTDKRVIVELPNRQTANRAYHNLTKL